MKLIDIIERRKDSIVHLRAMHPTKPLHTNLIHLIVSHYRAYNIYIVDVSMYYSINKHTLRRVIKRRHTSFKLN